MVNDALYRGSFFLLLNTVATSAIGFVFWTLAAHSYSASAVGVFSSVTAGTGPARGDRGARPADHDDADTSPEPTIPAIWCSRRDHDHHRRQGTVLCLLTVLVLGPHLPAALHIQQHGETDRPGDLAGRVHRSGRQLWTLAGRPSGASRFVLIKNLMGSTAELAAMLALARLPLVRTLSCLRDWAGTGHDP